MKDIVKSLFPYTPTLLKQFLYGSYETYFATLCKIKERKPRYKGAVTKFDNKINVLFYHSSLLSFGGTEKSLQIIAKHLDTNKFNVFVMYSDQHNAGRKNYLEQSSVNFIPFSYSQRNQSYPFFLSDMSPTLREVVHNQSIDVIITAGSGYTEYPLNTITNTPIIMINIFGSPSMQKNIVRHVSISHEVARKVEQIVPTNKSSVSYISSERPTELYRQKGAELRARLGLQDSDIVFGRIGRPDDHIFDPIGILAFKEVVALYPQAHYLIQSPPPILVALVKKEKIPHVHFLEPTSDEEKIWAFHFATDALAHFRKDGESCGLNIIESMIAGNPILSHKSPIWNAHLEYLEPSFSHIALQDDYKTYAQHMIEFITLKDKGQLKELGEKAQQKSALFLIENNIQQWEQWIEQAKAGIV